MAVWYVARQTLFPFYSSFDFIQYIKNVKHEYTQLIFLFRYRLLGNFVKVIIFVLSITTKPDRPRYVKD